MNDYFYLDAETAVLDNGIQFKAFVKQSPIAIAIYNLEGIGLYANEKYIKTLGLNQLEEFIGRPAYTYFAPQFVEESKDRIQRRLQGLPLPEEYESIAIHPDGSEFPVKLAIAPIELPGGRVNISFLTDISERKQLELAWKIESERYHAFLESTDDWVWIVEPEHFSLMIFNSAVAKYFWENENVILKTHMTLEEIVSEKSVEEVNGFYKKAKSDGKLVIDYCANEGKLHMKLTLSRLDVDDRTVGIAVVGKNVTKEIQYKDELEESNKSLSLMLWQSINTISRIGEMRDVYTAGHQKRVAELSCAIAKEMGLSEEETNNISLAALIHDIGKIYIASDILNKPGKITNLEYQILQTHAEQSYKVLEEIDFPGKIKTMIYQHHERMDGSGYPQKLKGSQIILEGRILAVADVVEAMSSHRPYRPALGIDAALEEIQTYKGIRYDTEVVEVCVKLFQDYNFNFNLDQN